MEVRLPLSGYCAVGYFFISLSLSFFLLLLSFSLFVRTLIDWNPDNYAYHSGLKTCLGLDASEGKYTTEQLKGLDTLYEGLAKKYPKSAAVTRLPLNWHSGEQFNSRVSQYLQKGLRKGVPSLFKDMRGLYATPEKAAFIDKSINDYLVSLAKDLSFPGGEAKSEAPSVLLWTQYYAANHYDFLSSVPAVTVTPSSIFSRF
jgi:peptide alpha-N-acetyltransferase